MHTDAETHGGPVGQVWHASGDGGSRQGQESSGQPLRWKHPGSSFVESKRSTRAVLTGRPSDRSHPELGLPIPQTSHPAPRSEWPHNHYPPFEGQFSTKPASSGHPSHKPPYYIGQPDQPSRSSHPAPNTQRPPNPTGNVARSRWDRDTNGPVVMEQTGYHQQRLEVQRMPSSASPHGQTTHRSSGADRRQRQAQPSAPSGASTLVGSPACQASDPAAQSVTTPRRSHWPPQTHAQPAVPKHTATFAVTPKPAPIVAPSWLTKSKPKPKQGALPNQPKPHGGAASAGFDQMCSGLSQEDDPYRKKLLDGRRGGGNKPRQHSSHVAIRERPAGAGGAGSIEGGCDPPGQPNGSTGPSLGSKQPGSVSLVEGATSGPTRGVRGGLDAQNSSHGAGLAPAQLPSQLPAQLPVELSVPDFERPHMEACGEVERWDESSEGSLLQPVDRGLGDVGEDAVHVDQKGGCELDSGGKYRRVGCAPYVVEGLGATAVAVAASAIASSLATAEAHDDKTRGVVGEEKVQERGELQGGLAAGERAPAGLGGDPSAGVQGQQTGQVAKGMDGGVMEQWYVDLFGEDDGANDGDNETRGQDEGGAAPDHCAKLVHADGAENMGAYGTRVARAGGDGEGQGEGSTVHARTGVSAGETAGIRVREEGEEGTMQAQHVEGDAWQHMKQGRHEAREAGRNPVHKVSKQDRVRETGCTPIGNERGVVPATQDVRSAPNEAQEGGAAEFDGVVAITASGSGLPAGGVTSHCTEHASPGATPQAAPGVPATEVGGGHATSASPPAMPPQSVASASVSEKQAGPDHQGDTQMPLVVATQPWCDEADSYVEGKKGAVAVRWRHGEDCLWVGSQRVPLRVAVFRKGVRIELVVPLMLLLDSKDKRGRYFFQMNGLVMTSLQVEKMKGITARQRWDSTWYVDRRSLLEHNPESGEGSEGSEGSDAVLLEQWFDSWDARREDVSEVFRGWSRTVQWVERECATYLQLPRHPNGASQREQTVHRHGDKEVASIAPRSDPLPGALVGSPAPARANLQLVGVGVHVQQGTALSPATQVAPHGESLLEVAVKALRQGGDQQAGAGSSHELNARDQPAQSAACPAAVGNDVQDPGAVGAQHGDAGSPIDSRELNVEVGVLPAQERLAGAQGAALMESSQAQDSIDEGAVAQPASGQHAREVCTGEASQSGRQTTDAGDTEQRGAHQIRDSAAQGGGVPVLSERSGPPLAEPDDGAPVAAPLAANAAVAELAPPHQAQGNVGAASKQVASAGVAGGVGGTKKGKAAANSGGNGEARDAQSRKRPLSSISGSTPQQASSSRKGRRNRKRKIKSDHAAAIPLSPGTKQPQTNDLFSELLSSNHGTRNQRRQFEVIMAATPSPSLAARTTHATHTTHSTAPKIGRTGRGPGKEQVPVAWADVVRAAEERLDAPLTKSSALYAAEVVQFLDGLPVLAAARLHKSNPSKVPSKVARDNVEWKEHLSMVQEQPDLTWGQTGSRLALKSWFNTNARQVSPVLTSTLLTWAKDPATAYAYKQQGLASKFAVLVELQKWALRLPKRLALDAHKAAALAHPPVMDTHAGHASETTVPAPAPAHAPAPPAQPDVGVQASTAPPAHGAQLGGALPAVPQPPGPPLYWPTLPRHGRRPRTNLQDPSPREGPHSPAAPAPPFVLPQQDEPPQQQPTSGQPHSAAVGDATRYGVVQQGHLGQGHLGGHAAGPGRHAFLGHTEHMQRKQKSGLEPGHARVRSRGHIVSPNEAQPSTQRVGATAMRVERPAPGPSQPPIVEQGVPTTLLGHLQHRPQQQQQPPQAQQQRLDASYAVALGRHEPQQAAPVVGLPPRVVADQSPPAQGADRGQHGSVLLRPQLAQQPQLHSSPLVQQRGALQAQVPFNRSPQQRHGSHQLLPSSPQQAHGSQQVLPGQRVQGGGRHGAMYTAPPAAWQAAVQAASQGHTPLQQAVANAHGSMQVADQSPTVQLCQAVLKHLALSGTQSGAVTHAQWRPQLPHVSPELTRSDLGSMVYNHFINRPEVIAAVKAGKLSARASAPSPQQTPKWAAQPAHGLPPSAPNASPAPTSGPRSLENAASTPIHPPSAPLTAGPSSRPLELHGQGLVPTHPAARLPLKSGRPSAPGQGDLGQIFGDSANELLLRGLFQADQQHGVADAAPKPRQPQHAPQVATQPVPQQTLSLAEHVQLQNRRRASMGLSAGKHAQQGRQVGEVQDGGFWAPELGAGHQVEPLLPPAPTSAAAPHLHQPGNVHLSHQGDGTQILIGSPTGGGYAPSADVVPPLGQDSVATPLTWSPPGGTLDTWTTRGKRSLKRRRDSFECFSQAMAALRDSDACPQALNEATQTDASPVNATQIDETVPRPDAGRSSEVPQALDPPLDLPQVGDATPQPLGGGVEDVAAQAGVPVGEQQVVEAPAAQDGVPAAAPTSEAAPETEAGAGSQDAGGSTLIHTRWGTLTQEELERRRQVQQAALDSIPGDFRPPPSGKPTLREEVAALLSDLQHHAVGYRGFVCLVTTARVVLPETPNDLGEARGMILNGLRSVARSSRAAREAREKLQEAYDDQELAEEGLRAAAEEALQDYLSWITKWTTTSVDIKHLVIPDDEEVDLRTEFRRLANALPELTAIIRDHMLSRLRFTRQHLELGKAGELALAMLPPGSSAGQMVAAGGEECAVTAAPGLRAKLTNHLEQLEQLQEQQQREWEQYEQTRAQQEQELAQQEQKVEAQVEGLDREGAATMKQFMRLVLRRQKLQDETQQMQEQARRQLFGQFIAHVRDIQQAMDEGGAEGQRAEGGGALTLHPADAAEAGPQPEHPAGDGPPAALSAAGGGGEMVDMVEQQGDPRPQWVVDMCGDPPGNPNWLREAEAEQLRYVPQMEPWDRMGMVTDVWRVHPKYDDKIENQFHAILWDLDVSPRYRAFCNYLRFRLTNIAVFEDPRYTHLEATLREKLIEEFYTRERQVSRGQRWDPFPEWEEVLEIGVLGLLPVWPPEHGPNAKPLLQSAPQAVLENGEGAGPSNVGDQAGAGALVAAQADQQGLLTMHVSFDVPHAGPPVQRTPGAGRDKGKKAIKPPKTRHDSAGAVAEEAARPKKRSKGKLGEISGAGGTTPLTTPLTARPLVPPESAAAAALTATQPTSQLPHIRAANGAAHTAAARRAVLPAPHLIPAGYPQHARVTRGQSKAASAADALSEQPTAPAKTAVQARPPAGPRSQQPRQQQQQAVVEQTPWPPPVVQTGAEQQHARSPVIGTQEPATPCGAAAEAQAGTADRSGRRASTPGAQGQAPPHDPTRSPAHSPSLRASLPPATPAHKIGTPPTLDWDGQAPTQQRKRLSWQGGRVPQSGAVFWAGSPESTPPGGGGQAPPTPQHGSPTPGVPTSRPAEARHSQGEEAIQKAGSGGDAGVVMEQRGVDCTATEAQLGSVVPHGVAEHAGGDVARGSEVTGAASQSKEAGDARNTPGKLQSALPAEAEAGGDATHAAGGPDAQGLRGGAHCPYIEPTSPGTTPANAPQQQTAAPHMWPPHMRQAMGVDAWGLPHVSSGQKPWSTEQQASHADGNGHVASRGGGEGAGTGSHSHVQMEAPHVGCGAGADDWRRAERNAEAHGGPTAHISAPAGPTPHAVPPSAPGSAPRQPESGQASIPPGAPATRLPSPAAATPRPSPSPLRKPPQVATRRVPTTTTDHPPSHVTSITAAQTSRNCARPPATSHTPPGAPPPLDSATPKVGTERTASLPHVHTADTLPTQPDVPLPPPPPLQLTASGSQPEQDTPRASPQAGSPSDMVCVYAGRERQRSPSLEDGEIPPDPKPQPHSDATHRLDQALPCWPSDSYRLGGGQHVSREHVGWTPGREGSGARTQRRGQGGEDPEDKYSSWVQRKRDSSDDRQHRRPVGERLGPVPARGKPRGLDPPSPPPLEDRSQSVGPWPQAPRAQTTPRHGEGAVHDREPTRVASPRPQRGRDAASPVGAGRKSGVRSPRKEGGRSARAAAERGVQRGESSPREQHHPRRQSLARGASASVLPHDPPPNATSLHRPASPPRYVARRKGRLASKVVVDAEALQRQETCGLGDTQQRGRDAAQQLPEPHGAHSHAHPPSRQHSVALPPQAAGPTTRIVDANVDAEAVPPAIAALAPPAATPTDKAQASGSNASASPHHGAPASSHRSPALGEQEPLPASASAHTTAPPLQQACPPHNQPQGPPPGAQPAVQATPADVSLPLADMQAAAHSKPAAPLPEKQPSILADVAADSGPAGMSPGKVARVERAPGSSPPPTMAADSAVQPQVQAEMDPPASSPTPAVTLQWLVPPVVTLPPTAPYNPSHPQTDPASAQQAQDPQSDTRQHPGPAAVPSDCQQGPKDPGLSNASADRAIGEEPGNQALQEGQRSEWRAEVGAPAAPPAPAPTSAPESSRAITSEVPAVVDEQAGAGVGLDEQDSSVVLAAPNEGGPRVEAEQLVSAGEAAARANHAVGQSATQAAMSSEHVAGGQQQPSDAAEQTAAGRQLAEAAENVASGSQPGEAEEHAAVARQAAGEAVYAAGQSGLQLGKGLASVLEHVRASLDLAPGPATGALGGGLVTYSSSSGDDASPKHAAPAPRAGPQREPTPRVVPEDAFAAPYNEDDIGRAAHLSRNEMVGDDAHADDGTQQVTEGLSGLLATHVTGSGVEVEPHEPVDVEARYPVRIEASEPAGVDPSEPEDGEALDPGVVEGSQLADGALSELVDAARRLREPPVTDTGELAHPQPATPPGTRHAATPDWASADRQVGEPHAREESSLETGEVPADGDTAGAERGEVSEGSDEESEQAGEATGAPSSNEGADTHRHAAERQDPASEPESPGSEHYGLQQQRAVKGRAAGYPTAKFVGAGIGGISPGKGRGRRSRVRQSRVRPAPACLSDDGEDGVQRQGHVPSGVELHPNVLRDAKLPKAIVPSTNPPAEGRPDVSSHRKGHKQERGVQGPGSQAARGDSGSTAGSPGRACSPGKVIGSGPRPVEEAFERQRPRTGALAKVATRRGSLARADSGGAGQSPLGDSVQPRQPLGSDRPHDAEPQPQRKEAGPRGSGMRSPSPRGEVGSRAREPRDTDGRLTKRNRVLPEELDGRSGGRGMPRAAEELWAAAAHCRGADSRCGEGGVAKTEAGEVVSSAGRGVQAADRQTRSPDTVGHKREREMQRDGRLQSDGRRPPLDKRQRAGDVVPQRTMRREALLARNRREARQEREERAASDVGRAHKDGGGRPGCKGGEGGQEGSRPRPDGHRSHSKERSRRCDDHPTSRKRPLAAAPCIPPDGHLRSRAPPSDEQPRERAGLDSRRSNQARQTLSATGIAASQSAHPRSREHGAVADITPHSPMLRGAGHARHEEGDIGSRFHAHGQEVSVATGSAARRNGRDSSARAEDSEHRGQSHRGDPRGEPSAAKHGEYRVGLRDKSRGELLGGQRSEQRGEQRGPQRAKQRGEQQSSRWWQRSGSDEERDEHERPRDAGGPSQPLGPQASRENARRGGDDGAARHTRGTGAHGGRGEHTHTRLPTPRNRKPDLDRLDGVAHVADDRGTHVRSRQPMHKTGGGDDRDAARKGRGGGDTGVQSEQHGGQRQRRSRHSPDDDAAHRGRAVKGSKRDASEAPHRSGDRREGEGDGKVPPGQDCDVGTHHKTPGQVSVLAQSTPTSRTPSPEPRAIKPPGGQAGGSREDSPQEVGSPVASPAPRSRSPTVLDSSARKRGSGRTRGRGRGRRQGGPSRKPPTRASSIRYSQSAEPAPEAAQEAAQEAGVSTQPSQDPPVRATRTRHKPRRYQDFVEKVDSRGVGIPRGVGKANARGDPDEPGEVGQGRQWGSLPRGNALGGETPQDAGHKHKAGRTKRKADELPADNLVGVEAAPSPPKVSRAQEQAPVSNPKLASLRASVNSEFVNTLAVKLRQQARGAANGHQGRPTVKALALQSDEEEGEGVTLAKGSAVAPSPVRGGTRAKYPRKQRGHTSGRASKNH